MMKRAGLFGIDDMPLVKEVMVTEFVSKEAARDVNFLASYDDNFLAGKDLLGDYRRQATKEMSLAINYDGCRGEGGHSEVLRGLTVCAVWRKDSGLKPISNLV